MMRFRVMTGAMLLAAICGVRAAAAAEPLRVLFLGDEGHHRPAERFAQVQGMLANRGIEMVYTDSLDDLSPKSLAGYDVLAVYANIDSLPGPAEAAIMDYVREGGGVVPLHCASFCFRDSPFWISLVGAQFERHGTGEFRTEIVAADHPVMQGFEGFESWDETYVHRLHNDRGRTVLANIAQSTGGHERLDLGEVWNTLPRQPRFVQLSVWLVIAALVLFLLEVLQRRTGIFHFGRRTAPAIDEEVEVSTTPLKRRKSIAQAGPTAKEEREQKKVFRAPKPKRKHRESRPDDAPPIVAPPMVVLQKPNIISA